MMDLPLATPGASPSTYISLICWVSHAVTPANSSTVMIEVTSDIMVDCRKIALMTIATMMPIEAIMKKPPRPDRSRLVT